MLWNFSRRKGWANFDHAGASGRQREKYEVFDSAQKLDRSFLTVSNERTKSKFLTDVNINLWKLDCNYDRVRAENDSMVLSYHFVSAILCDFSKAVITF